MDAGRCGEWLLLVPMTRPASWFYLSEEGQLEPGQGAVRSQRAGMHSTKEKPAGAWTFVQEEITRVVGKRQSHRNNQPSVGFTLVIQHDKLLS